MSVRRVLLGFAVAVPAAFTIWFVAWPAIAIVGRGLAPGGRLDLSALGEVFTSERLARAARFTVVQASVSTVLALALGLPATWALARLRFRGAALTRSLLVVPFALPTVVLAGAFSALFGRSGPLSALGWAPGTPAIVFANVVFNLSVVVVVVGAHWSGLDPRTEDAARVLGASSLRVAREVTLPLLAPAIIAAGGLVFVFCVTSFGVVRLLGGPAQSTLETEIYRLAVGQFRLDRAAALALVQVVAVGVALAIAGRAQRRSTVMRGLVANEARRAPRSIRERLLLPVVLAAPLTLVTVPLAVLVVRSLRADGQWSTAAYRDFASTDPLIGAAPLDALVRSATVAVVATLIALVVGALASVAVVALAKGPGRVLGALVALPLVLSAVTLGYGYLIALDRPVDLRTSWLLVPIAHASVAVPFVVRSVVPGLRAIDTRLREAAALSGASPLRVWREIDLPLVRRPLFAAAALAGAISLGEFGATSFVARAGSPTVPIAIGRLLGRPGSANYQRALALAVVLMIATAVLMAGSERLGRRGWVR